MVKNWYTSKTIWIGVLQVLIGIGGLLASFFGTGVYSAEAVTLLITGSLMVILRLMTTDAVM